MKNKLIYLTILTFLFSSCGGATSITSTSNSTSTTKEESKTFTKEDFLKARDNTVGENIPGYEYDYLLNVSVSYMGLALTGKTQGNSKYNVSSLDVSFYDEHLNSGALFYDGSKYQIKKGINLHEVSLDEDGIVKKYAIKQVDESYKYDSSSFAKAIFEYDDSKFKDIKKTSTENEYELKTTFNASAGIALVGNYINHPIVEKIIGTLPETSVDTKMYVTILNEKLTGYRYLMNIDVSGLTFALTYSLTFKNIGVAPSITPKVFNNTFVSDAEVKSAKEEINTYLDSYKALEHSSYDFTVKTAVGYQGKNDINATVKGFSKRKVTSSDVFYLNDYEVDTDHKNADLYKEHDLTDCHGARVKLSNGEVHDLKKKATSIGGRYDDIKVVSHTDEDNYYLFDVLKMIDNVNFIQRLDNNNNSTTTYSLGADNTGATAILNNFNSLLRLNPLGVCDVEVKAFGEFNASSVSLKDFEFKITTTNRVFSSLTLEMNGKYISSYPNSRDFLTKQDASFKLEVSISKTSDGDSYEPASVIKDVK